MAKTYQQLKTERKRSLEERQQFLMKFPEVYQRDFDKAVQNYLKRAMPDVDPEDCDVLFDPDLREKFLTGWPEEAQELSLTYHLGQVWDPDGNELPEPMEEVGARPIRCQDERIWAKQINPDSILNLSPQKVFGRFLLVEIDLSKPRREIAANLMAVVDQERKQLKISGSHHELVSPPEPKDKESSYIYNKMEVWEMVEKERQTFDEEERKVLWHIATYKTNETIDSYDEIKWNREEKRIYNALINAYKRDKKIYYGI